MKMVSTKHMEGEEDGSGLSFPNNRGWACFKEEEMKKKKEEEGATEVQVVAKMGQERK